MGLFKKKLTHNEKVDRAYSCYKPEVVEMIYPGGKAQAGKIIASLARVYNLNLDSCDTRSYFNILSTYSDVLVGRVITQSSDENIIALLQEKHPDLVKSKEAAQRALAFVSLNMVNNDFFLDSEDDMSALDFTAGIFTEQEETMKENAEVVNNDIDDSNYGLIMEMPIYTNGVSGSNKYLESLVTEDGKPITWERLGSTSCPEVKGMIDIYDIFSDGKKYSTLYINMYAPVNSDVPPKGFKFKGEEVKNDVPSTQKTVEVAPKPVHSDISQQQMPSDEIRFCFRCGAPVDEDAIYCIKCGNKVR